MNQDAVFGGRFGNIVFATVIDPCRVSATLV